MKNHEISGFLDGELADETARVKQAIAQDEEMRREYEELAALDEDLRAMANAAAFEPAMTIPAPAQIPFDIRFLILAAIIVRVFIKSSSMATGCLVGVLMLAVVIWGIGKLIEASECAAAESDRS